MTSTVDQQLQLEQSKFDAEVASIEAWWKTPRHAHLKRPYSAASIAAMRNTIPQTYVSSQQGLKLWEILREHNRNGTSEMTFAVNDPLAMLQMVKHQKTVYASGGLCGFSHVQYPGMDHADYPWDTVPKMVDKIFQAQLWNDQKQRQLRMRVPISERGNLKNLDYMMPIVADGDMGFGALTSTVKMTRAFVEAGVAMIHIDDLALGLKRFGTGEGKTLIPTSEYLNRVTSIRMQYDIMGVDTLLLARCDVDHSEFLTSVIDPRDQEYVLGATKAVGSHAVAIEEAIMKGTDKTVASEEWKKAAGVMTFDEAVKAQVNDEEKFTKYLNALSFPTSLSSRRELAKEITGQVIFFDWDLARRPTGQYLFKPTVKTIVERATAAVPLSDVTWARMDFHDYRDMEQFHATMREKFPDRMFAFGWNGVNPFSEAKGFTPENLKTLSADFARECGVVWQVQPIFASNGLNETIERFCEMWQNEGIGGYVEHIQKPGLARKPPVDQLEFPDYNGAYLADAFMDVVDGVEIAKK